MNLSNLTVEQLRKSGVKIRVQHFRKLYGENRYYPKQVLEVQKQMRACSPRGGKTEVTLTMPDGKVYFGASRCSKNDNFCYRQGVKWALSRLEQVFNH